MKNEIYQSEKILLERQWDTGLPLLFYILGGVFVAVGLLLLITLGVLGLIPLFLGVVAICIGVALRPYCSVHLVVTTRRVYCVGPFDAYTTLPLGGITAVSIGRNNYVHVGSSGGHIHAYGVPDHYGVYNMITAVLAKVPGNAMEEYDTPAPAPQPAPEPASESIPEPAPAPKEEAKPKPAAPAPKDRVQYDDYWICGKCGTKNMNSRTTCWSCE